MIKKLITFIFMGAFTLTMPVWIFPLALFNTFCECWELIQVLCDNPKNSFKNFHRKIWTPKEQLNERNN